VSAEKTKFYLEQLAKNGMTVAPPTAALQSELKKIGETMTADWIKGAGADGKAIVEAYRK
jgi:TRAP-type C4-dicarboxylate transport system substrate-binding protein